MKRVKRYLLLLALGTTALFSGYSWLDEAIEDAFITVASGELEATIKDKAEDRLKEKLFNLLEDL